MSDTKVCFECKADKDVSAFHRLINKSGKISYWSTCNNCIKIKKGVPSSTNETKTCIRCNKTKNVSNFRKLKTKNNEQLYNPTCKDCVKIKNPPIDLARIKICEHCNKEKDLSNFQTDDDEGKNFKYEFSCNDCLNEIKVRLIDIKQKETCDLCKDEKDTYHFYRKPACNRKHVHCTTCNDCANRLKKCNICKAGKDVSHFHKNGKRDGRQSYYPTCKDCSAIKRNIPIDTSKQKVCQVCDIKRDLSDFRKCSKGGVYGYDSTCNVCSNKIKYSPVDANREQTCNNCNKSKSLTEFKKKYVVNGRLKFEKTCEECIKEIGHQADNACILMKCDNCGKDKHSTEFGKTGIKNKKQTYESTCKECNNLIFMSRSSREDQIKKCDSCNSDKCLSEYDAFRAINGKVDYNKICRSCSDDIKNKRKDDPNMSFKQNEHKTCEKCYKSKCVSEFRQSHNRFEKIYYYSVCKECVLESIKDGSTVQKTHNTCKQCNKEKEVSEFRKNVVGCNKIYYELLCRSCQYENRMKKPRQCKECNLPKPLEDFCVNGFVNYKPKYTNRCKECITTKYDINWDATENCVTCHKDMSLNNFFICNNNSEGTMFMNQCEFCYLERQTRLMKNNNTNIIICNYCGEEKDCENFYRKNKSGKSKYYTTCKDCSSVCYKNFRKKSSDYVNQKKQEIGACQMCGIFHPFIMEFDHNQGIKNANICQIRNIKKIDVELQLTQLLCGNCHRIKTQDDILKNKLLMPGSTNPVRRNKNKEYVDELKKAGCTKCGYKNDDCPSVFEYDHIDRRTKRENVSKMVNWHSLEDVKREILKCQLLCCNCHKIKTMENRDMLPLSKINKEDSN